MTMESKTTKKIALSPAKLAANRANALKSTGPGAPEGQRRSAANARVTHGFRTHEPKLSEADLAEIAELQIHLTAQWRLATPETAVLMDEAAAATWRMDQILMTIDEALNNPDLNPTPTAALDRYLATADAARPRARKALQANLHARTQTERPESSDSHERTQTGKPETTDLRQRTQTGQSQASDLRQRTQTGKPETSDLRQRTQTVRQRTQTGQSEASDLRQRTQIGQPEASDSHERTQTAQAEPSDLQARTQTGQPEASDLRQRTQTGHPEASDLRQRTQTGQSQASDLRQRTQTGQPEASDSHERTQTAQAEPSDLQARTQLDPSAQGKLAALALARPASVEWIIRRGPQAIWKKTVPAENVAIELPLDRLEPGIYKLEANADGEARSVDLPVKRPQPGPRAATVSFNANLTPAARMEFVGHQWTLRRKLDEAVSCLRDSIAKSPASGAQVELAQVEALAGRYDEARDRLHAVLGNQPNNFDALSVMAYTEAKLQDYVVAAELYRRALIQDSPALRLALASPQRADRGPHYSQATPVRVRDPGSVLRAFTEEPAKGRSRPSLFASQRPCESAIQAPFCGRLLS
jgi:hypothetical protein